MKKLPKKNIINKRKIIISILLFAIIVYSIIVVYKLIGNPVDNFLLKMVKLHSKNQLRATLLEMKLLLKVIIIKMV